MEERDCNSDVWNPCYYENQHGRIDDAKCKFPHQHNINMEGLKLNKLNVSCKCGKSSHTWSNSLYACIGK